MQNAQQQVYSVSHHDVLAGLGLSEFVLRDALRSGASLMAGCTHSHPSSAPGFYLWSETFSALADMLLPSGWTKLETNNLPVLVNPDRTVGVITSSGSKETGRSTTSPIKQNTGPATVTLVANNVIKQLELPVMATASAAAPLLQPQFPWTTWAFLFYRDVRKQEIRCELSRPNGFNGDLSAVKWADRIILEPISLDPDTVINHELEREGEPRIDVEVTRKR